VTREIPRFGFLEDLFGSESEGKKKLSVAYQEEIFRISNRVDFKTLSGKKVLVTGGTGMLGAYLVDVLLRVPKLLIIEPPSITLLVRDTKSTNLKELNLENFDNLTLENWSTWIPKSKYDFLIHAASPASPVAFANHSDLRQPNLGFLESLALHGLPQRTLFLSSSEIYGSNAPVGVLETHPAGIFPNTIRSEYPKVKLATEKFLLKQTEIQDVSCVIVRLFHSFGPGVRSTDGRSFADFIWAGALGQPIILRSKGQDLRTFLYLEDAVAGLLTALFRGVSGGIYNLGSEDPMSILEFASTVANQANVEVRAFSENPDLNSGYLHSPNTKMVPDTVKMQELGWSQEVPIHIGIQRTLKWVRKQVNQSMD